MIRQEYYKTRNDGTPLYRTYSDSGLYVKQVETGKTYKEAIDVYPLKYTYVEVSEEQKATPKLATLLEKFKNKK